MKDLKIRVANEAESKEAQELFDALGYSKDAFENKSTPCWIAICDGFTYSDYNIGKSVWYTACPKEITLQELRDMVNPMKEYLEKQADGSYKLVMRGIVGKDGDIEVPEGADCARSTCSRLEFYKDNLNLFFSIRGDCWKNTISSRGMLSQNIVWQRHVQPEELPFIDDGPKIETATGYQLDVVGKNTYGSRSRESGESDTSYRQYLMNFKIDQSKSLNDQYAEIEQVRQSGMKFDSNKPRHSLLPKGAVNSVIDVLEFGAKKYSADNWQEVDNAKERYYNAAMRHIDLWWNGEKLDPETNVHHLAHAATNLFFLMWFDNK